MSMIYYIYNPSSDLGYKCVCVWIVRGPGHTDTQLRSKHLFVTWVMSVCVCVCVLSHTEVVSPFCVVSLFM